MRAVRGKQTCHDVVTIGGLVKAGTANTAKVAAILGLDTLIINRGDRDGVMCGDVYLIDPVDVIDPDSGEIIGRSPRYGSRGTVISTDERMAGIEVSGRAALGSVVVGTVVELDRRRSG